MTSRSDCEPLPKPTLSPFALARPGTFLRVGSFHCRSVVCACSAGTVGSFSNKPLSQQKKKRGRRWPVEGRDRLKKAPL